MSVDEIIERERKGAFGFTDDRRCLFTYGDFRRLLMEIEEAWKREQELLRSCARWISTHDIYGNMSKELLEECANVLDDDGEFLELEGEDEHIGKSC